MNTFLPYKDFRKSALCLDYKRLGKQRVEVWQIYKTLKQGEYTKCKHCYKGYKWNGLVLHKCKKCKGIGKVKTVWYNHPIVKMWKGYDKALLLYGWYICEEWKNRGYKDNMQVRFIDEMNLQFYNKEINYPKWLGNKKFHLSMRSNLLRKDKKYYFKFGWKIKDNLPYYWIIK